MIQKLSRNNIDFNMLVEKFIEGEHNLKSLLMDVETPYIRKASPAIKIIEFFNDLKNVIEEGLPDHCDD